MLSKEEQKKIEMEERLRQEIIARQKPKTKIDLLEKAIKILQGMAIIIGIWATYNAYRKQNMDRLQQEKQQFEQTAKEFRKYFYQKQLEYYAEVTEATATLATEKIQSEDYKTARKKFFRLFWGKLSIVEDKLVEASMVRFRNLLLASEEPGSNVSSEELQQASLSLAHDASRYTINVWIDSAERKNYSR